MVGIPYEEIKRERDRLRAEKRTLINPREEHTELVEYVQEEREFQKQRQQKENAPAWMRAKYWLLGFPDDDE